MGIPYLVRLSHRKLKAQVDYQEFIIIKLIVQTVEPSSTEIASIHRFLALWQGLPL